MSSVCGGCHNKIKTNEFMVCSSCDVKFDLECCNITVKRFNAFSLEKKSNWTCCGCSSRRPKTDNTNTPVRSGAQAPSGTENVTKRNASKSKMRRASSGDAPSEIPDSDGTNRNDNDIRTIIREEISLAIKGLTKEMQNVGEKVSSFEQSLLFFNTCYEELKKCLEEKSTVIDQLQRSNAELTLKVVELEKGLNGRLNQIEQHQRECNVEINGIPESRSENVLKIIEQLSKKTDCSISENDIVHVSRVAKLNKESDRPRTVILKLRTRLMRDHLLAAVQRFNKTNTRDKLCSAHLGIGGNSVPVFVSEHLSPTNKAIHAAARKKAKELRYKFVWVRDGRIYARKDETSAAILIRTMDSNFFTFKN